MKNQINYISTRGEAEKLGFQQAVLTGLATDGGLLIPDAIPDVSARLADWAALSYEELAYEITRLFTDIPEADLRELIEASYSTFRVPDVCPVVSVGGVRVLELFHGPTLAFKDVALQWLGNLFEYILERTGKHLNILAATSGDTGSAAIYGVRGKANIHIFVMHPDGRVSPTQERQMTSVLDDNVFNLAVKGTFDDCQRMMKAIFRDVPFKQQHALGTVNSVNWARVLAQIVYYFYAGLRVMKEEGVQQVQFSVPTGNFGDILAGYYATRMGLPVSRLILATNENDILSRFFRTGIYGLGEVVPTLSPSMDIQVASNFERYLYYKLGESGERVREIMEHFDATGSLSVPKQTQDAVDPLFAACATDRDQTLEVIRRYHRDHGYLVDPHTATGIHAAEELADGALPVICLATAHPAKFSQAILVATGEDLAHHEILDGLVDAETRCVTLDACEQAIRDYVVRHAL
jgi:threonine synthase